MPYKSTISVESIFNKALAEFSLEFSKDGKQKEWVIDSTCSNFESVLASVEEARVHYEEQKGDSTIRKGLVQLSEKLYNYSNIMDVLLSQQPKYSALAWGAMKCLLLVSIPMASTICPGSSELKILDSYGPREISFATL